MKMTEPKKHYPTDLNKLRLLLDKKEAELERLQQEVKELRARVLEANRTAIHSVCEMYSLTPELLAEFLKEKFGGDPIPELPKGAVPVSTVSEYPMNPEKEAFADDDE